MDCCQNTLHALERGKESGFRCHGHAVAMVTTHLTFLQPLLNKEAFETLFIRTKGSMRPIVCMILVETDAISLQGKRGQLCGKLAELFHVKLTEVCCPLVKTSPSLALSLVSSRFSPHMVTPPPHSLHQTGIPHPAIVSPAIKQEPNIDHMSPSMHA